MVFPIPALADNDIRSTITKREKFFFLDFVAENNVVFFALILSLV